VLGLLAELTNELRYVHELSMNVWLLALIIAAMAAGPVIAPEKYWPVPPPVDTGILMLLTVVPLFETCKK
jgi:hypothetical protein